MLKGNGTIQNLSIDLSRNDPELNDFEQLALIDPRLQFTLNLEEESSASEEPSFEEKE